MTWTLACPEMSPVGFFNKAGVVYVVNDLYGQDGDSPDPLNNNFALRDLTDNMQIRFGLFCQNLDFFSNHVHFLSGIK